MKKYYTTKKYKRWNNKKSTKGLKKRNKSYTLNKSINASLSTKTQ